MTDPHPLVLQLRFTRARVPARPQGRLATPTARMRLGPMNCIAWNVGHLAWQEQRYFVIDRPGAHAVPGARRGVRSRRRRAPRRACPRRSPPGGDPAEADPWLDDAHVGVARRDAGPARAAPRDDLRQPRPADDLPLLVPQRARTRRSGSRWATRRLPQFVGNIDGEAPYRPEPRGLSDAGQPPETAGMTWTTRAGRDGRVERRPLAVDEQVEVGPDRRARVQDRGCRSPARGRSRSRTRRARCAPDAVTRRCARREQRDQRARQVDDRGRLALSQRRAPRPTRSAAGCRRPGSRSPPSSAEP